MIPNPKYARPSFCPYVYIGNEGKNAEVSSGLNKPLRLKDNAPNPIVDGEMFDVKYPKIQAVAKMALKELTIVISASLHLRVSITSCKRQQIIVPNTSGVK